MTTTERRSSGLETNLFHELARSDERILAGFLVEFLSHLPDYVGVFHLLHIGGDAALETI